MLSSSQIEDFKELYRKNFGVNLSTQEARIQSTKLLLLFATTYKPIKKEDYMKYGESYEKRKKNGSF